MLDEIATIYGDAIIKALVNPYGGYDHRETTAAIRENPGYDDFSDRDLNSAFRSAHLAVIPLAEMALANVDRLRDTSILSLEDDVLAMRHAIRAKDERRGRISYRRLLAHQRANEHEDIYMPVEILLAAPESWRPRDMMIDAPDGWTPHGLTILDRNDNGSGNDVGQDRDRDEPEAGKNGRGPAYDGDVEVDLYDAIEMGMTF